MCFCPGDVITLFVNPRGCNIESSHFHEEVISYEIKSLPSVMPCSILQFVPIICHCLSVSAADDYLLLLHGNISFPVECRLLSQIVKSFVRAKTAVKQLCSPNHVLIVIICCKICCITEEL